MEWVAEKRTKVVGTFPRKKGWTGYVEKDTAGQTNIYSIEPAVYVAGSAISSGTSGSSADGVENTAGVAAFLALISIAAASSILLQVGKNSPPQVQTMEYSGPSLSYYISEFKPPEVIQASMPAETIPVQPEASVPSETITAQPEPSVPSETIPVQPEASAPILSEVETLSALLLDGELLY